MPTPHLFRAARLACALAAAAAAPAPLRLEPCTVPGLAGEARCGTYEVFEDRAASAGRKVPLNVVVLPATGDRREPDPLVYFAGGPGEPATAEAPELARAFPELRRSRDVVLVDARGTGRSSPLNCTALAGERGLQAFLDDFLPVAGVRACRREHEATAALAQYNTPNAVDDVAEVLAALGYDRVNLAGGSYGTQAALAFLRRHPHRVRTLTLQGVVPPDAEAPLTLARDAQQALDSTLAECAADPVCGKAFPRLGEELAAVVARLEASPVTVAVRHPQSGRPLSLRLGRLGFAQLVRYMLYQPTSAVLLPLYVHAAAGGDYRPLVEFAAFLASQISPSGDGVYLSVTCGEEVAYIEEAAIAAATRGTFLGDFRIRAQQAACREWGVPPLGGEVNAPVRSDVPALLVSGERDPATPVRWGDEVARHLSRSRHLVVPDGAHNFNGMGNADCPYRLVERFVIAGAAEGLDTSCLAAMERPPFATELPGPEVPLDPARLAALAGVYGSPESGVEVRVELAEGSLRAVLSVDEAYVLVPLGQARFRVLGMAVGRTVEFEEQDGHVTALRLVEASQTLTLPRRQP